MASENAQIAVSMEAMPQDEGTLGGHTGNSSRCIEISTCHLVTASLCQDHHHRKLAISSILCGLSCIGIISLINSVKAREARNPKKAEQYSKKARKYGILSIVVWVTILVMFPALVVLVSYLLTLID